MTHMQFLNSLMASILAMALIICEALAYKLKYNLTPCSYDEIIIFFTVLQALAIYFVLMKLKFNQGENL